MESMRWEFNLDFSSSYQNCPLKRDADIERNNAMSCKYVEEYDPIIATITMRWMIRPLSGIPSQYQHARQLTILRTV